jgi:streptogrisin C
MRKLVLQFVTLLFIVTLPLFGQSSESLLQDATSYAALEGIGVDEAVRRLRLQQQVSELDEALAAEDDSTFAGLWIQHGPQYRVVARFTDPAAEGRLRARVAGGPLAGLIEIRRARWSLAELESRRQQVRGHARRGKVPFNSEINVFENRVELSVLDPQKLNAALTAARAALPDGVVVRRVSQLAVPEALVGGSTIAGCTAGFTVQAPNGELGVSTAGHCPDNQFFNGLFLPFRSQRGGDADMQWNSACDIVQVTNQFETGIGLRSCTATRHRNNQSIGTFLCKFGRTTGRTCGTIDSKSIDIGDGFNSTFVRVDGDRYGVDLSKDGDSGSPWFVENIAYGIHYGAPSTTSFDAIYSAINYISNVGVSVLTSNPGVCNLLPAASFTGSTRFDGTATFNGSASSDPDGSIVRWEWDFDDGTTGVSTTPYITHVYPQNSGAYYITLTVTDNEGKRASASREICVPAMACVDRP